MPGPYSAGAIFLQIFPSFRGTEAAIEAEGREFAREFGKGFDDEVDKSVAPALKRAVEKGSKESAGKAGKAAGEDYSGRFQEAIKRGISGAQREVDRLKVNLDDKEARKKLTALQVGLKGLDARIGVDIDSGKALLQFAKLEQAARDLHDASTNLEFRTNIGSAIRGIATIRAEVESLSRLDIEPNLKVDRQIGLFERALKQGVKGALDSLPPIEIDVDNAEATTRIAELRERLIELGDVAIDVDVDSASAFAELARVEEELRVLADTATDMKLRVDAAGALTTIASVRGELEALSRMTIEPELEVDRDMGAFERGLHGAIQNALKELGPIDLPLDPRFDNAGQQALRSIRQQLIELQDNVINMRVSDETAVAEIHRLRDDLESLSHEGWTARVDADTAAAAAQLEALLRALNRLDGDTAHIGIELDGAISSAVALAELEHQAKNAGGSSNSAANSFRAFNGVLFGLTTIGPAAIPVLGGIAGALLALGPLAIAGGAALGVIALGLSGVGGAVKALNQEQATSATQQQAYTRAVQTSAASVRDAEQGIASARESAARSAQSSERAVEQALQGVEQAEQGVRDAQRDRQRAQEDLTRAVKDATEQQQDLTLSLRDSELGEQEAALNLRQAQEELAAGIAGGATGDDLLELQLRVQRYQLTLDQAAERTGDLKEQTAEFARTGVEGTDQVRTARERLADSDRRIADAQAQVAQAQSAVVDARRNADQQAADSARSVRDAQERLTDAQTRYTESLTNVNAAQNKVTQSMAALSPAGRDFANFLFGLKGELQGFRFIAQEGFLPGLQDWMQTITGTYGPQLQRTIFNLSSAVGDMFSQFGSALLTTPFRDLFDMIETDGPRFIGYMADILTNLGSGVASLIVALEPLGDLFGSWLMQGSKAFADWAAGLKGSDGLREFFLYIERIGPKIWDFIQAIAGAVWNLAKALAPYGEMLLGLLTGIAGWIARMDTAKLGAITIAIITAIAAMQTIFGITAGLKSIAEAWRGIAAVGDLLGGKWATLLGSATLLAGALFILYQNSEDFRAVVDALWRNVLQPVAEFLSAVLVPILDGMGEVIDNNVNLIAAVAAGFAAWKIITVVMGWVTGLRTALLGLAAAQTVVTSSGIMTGPGNAARGLGGAAAGGVVAGGAAGAGGAALPLLGLGVAAFAATTDQDQDRVDQWTQTILQGGKDMADLQAKYEKALEQKSSIGSNLKSAFTFGDLWNDDDYHNVIDEFDTAKEKADAYWHTLDPLSQAESKVAEWSETLRYRQQTLGDQDDLTAAAHRRLEYWTRQVEVAQEDTTVAVDTMNQSLLEQQGVAVALAQAQIGYEQAVTALDTAHQRYVDTLNDENATEADRTAALEAYTTQALGTAQAAAQVAAARHLNADGATREAYSNAALLIDLERQKALYGELPPRLEELRAGLAATVDPAVVAATKMENLGLKVSAIPNSKTMVFDTEPTEEQIALLESLGFKVEHLPDGTVTATAQTSDAEAALNQVARDRTSTITQNVQLATAVTQTGDFVARPGVVVRQARGGPIWGPGTATSDSIPAWLSNGEFVVRAAAVSRYGLGLLHDINAMRFADGGFVGQKFADGGFAANWGGTIDLKGGDVSPLAALWVQAIVQINSLSQVAADLIGNSFRVMRDRVLGELLLSKDGATSLLSQQMATMLQLTLATNDAMYADHLRYSTQLLGLAGATTSTVQGIYLGFYGSLLSLTVATNGALYTEQLHYATQYMALAGAMTSTVQGMYIQFGGAVLQLFSSLTSTLLISWANFSTSMINLTTGMVNVIAAQFDRLRPVTANPVNFVINAVLNQGLFPALNSISNTFGLGQVVPTATAVKLAAGGSVYGFSPSKTADNIPAWLTAGEFVHPVDSVNYYGADFMEMLRRRQIPREMLPGFATGGQATWQQLNALRAKLFPGSVMTSGLRPGANDLHGAGMAIDIGVPGNIVARLIPIAQSLARMYPQSAEIINNPGASVKNGRPVPPSFWGATTWAQHANHVHWAMTMAQLLMGPNPAGYVSGAGGVSSQDVLSQLTNSVLEPIKQLTAQFGSNPFTGALAAIPAKLITEIWGKIHGRVEDALAVTLGGEGSLAGVQTTGPVQDIVRSVASQFGWNSGPQWDALAQLIQHESGWRPNAQNPSSTAYGLFQFLNGTWAGTGIAKTSDPAQQTLAGLRYIKSRYSDPVGAWNFWSRNHWYSEGGPVESGPITPELMDTGGWIHPGLNVIMNKTGRPEPVINPATLDALVSIGEGGGAPLIGQYTQQVVSGTPREAVDELLHKLDAALLGGRYSRRD